MHNKITMVMSICQAETGFLLGELVSFCYIFAKYLCLQWKERCLKSFFPFPKLHQRFFTPQHKPGVEAKIVFLRLILGGIGS